MFINRKIPFRLFINAIRLEVLLVTIYMLFIGYMDEYVQLKDISIPLSIPAIIGTALSFLLGFRINQAYQRWWEARINWGAIVNDSRTLVRQAQAFIKDGSDIIQRLAYRQMAWNYALGQSLRRLDSCQNIDQFINTGELDDLRNKRNVPNAILSLNSQEILQALTEGKLNQYQQVKLENTLEKLTDSMGKCERIKGTVFPVMYSILVHVFIYLFVILLPLGLVDFLGYVEIPLVIAIATMFFIIEKATFAMQNPFENKPGDTAMTQIARNIEIDLRQMLGETDLPEPIQPNNYYVM